MFLIYINDIGVNIKSHIRLFADDTNELKILRRQTSGTASGNEVTARITSGCRRCEVSRRRGLVCGMKKAILPSRLERE